MLLDLVCAISLPMSEERFNQLDQAVREASFGICTQYYMTLFQHGVAPKEFDDFGMSQRDYILYKCSPNLHRLIPSNTAVSSK